MSDCYNARTLEAEAGGQWVWGQPKLHSKTLDSREVQKGIAMVPVFIYMKRSPHVQIKGRSNPHPPVQQTRPHYRLGKFKQVPTRKAPFSQWLMSLSEGRNLGPDTWRKCQEKMETEIGAMHLGATVPWGVTAATKFKEACSRFLLLPASRAS